MEQLIQNYNLKKTQIKSRLNEFRNLKNKNYIYELIFCTLTPQSQAKKCWQAVTELKPNLPNLSQKEISNILKSKARFHNNKSKYILENLKNWKIIEAQLTNQNIPDLRNWLAKNVAGFGLKEAGHFLRNVGKSNNQIAILDRHILRNLKNLKIINEDQIKNNKHYLEIESKFILFSKKIEIPIDELDLLFWSQENGEIFK